MKRSLDDQTVITALEQDHFRDITTFKLEGDTYVINSKMKTFFNKIFGSKLHAVYTLEGKKHSTENGLDWSGEEIIIVNSSGKIISMTNSEWASFNYL